MELESCPTKEEIYAGPRPAGLVVDKHGDAIVALCADPTVDAAHSFYLVVARGL